MPRRNLIPLVLLAALAVLTAVFALLGLSNAPPTGSLVVQNATARSFGSPAGSIRFAVELTTRVASREGAGGTSDHLIDYVPPDRMTIYQVTPHLAPLGRLPASAISCVLSSYTATVEGATPWKATGKTYSRTESLAEFSARVPRPNGRTCTPQPSPAQGRVLEKAIVRSGYLIALQTITVIPSQRLSGGQRAQSGSQSETLVLLQIGGTATRKLIS